MRLLLIPLLLLIYSCSSTTKYPAEHHDSEYMTFDNKLTGERKTMVVFKQLPVLADKYLKSGRINKFKHSSCFKDGQSVNYIEIDQAYIHMFRPYVTKTDVDYSYHQYTGFRNKKYDSIQYKTVNDNLRIEQKRCFMNVTLNDHTEYVAVISEKYSALRAN